MEGTENWEVTPAGQCPLQCEARTRFDAYSAMFWKLFVIHGSWAASISSSKKFSETELRSWEPPLTLTVPSQFSVMLNTELCPCLTVTECLHFTRRLKGALSNDLGKVGPPKRLRDVKHNYSDINAAFQVLGTPVAGHILPHPRIRSPILHQCQNH